MARLLVIGASIELPDDAFKQASLVHKAAEARDVFQAALSEAFGRPIAVEARFSTTKERPAPDLVIPIKNVTDEQPDSAAAKPKLTKAA